MTTDRRYGVNGNTAIKTPCRACSTSNITLSGEQTIDGVAVVDGDRVLVTGQTSGANNGIYECDTGTWSRTKDWDGNYDIVTGTLVYVTSGTSNSGWYYVATTGTITIGTTSVTISMAGTSLAAVSAYIQTLLNDADAATARATLGITDATAKGDILTATAAGAFTRKAVGSNGYLIVADSSQSDGIVWVPNEPRSLAPNPFFEVDQLVNSLTSVADDNYGHDHWYVLTQTASVQVSTQTLQENGQTTNARLTQNQAAAQRMGYASIIESKEAQKLRGQTLTFKPRIRCSSSQAIRCAVVEWTGTADSVTSDIVNDWTSSDYTDGAARFFVDANQAPLGTSTTTPSAATWTDATALNVTVGSSCNNLILFVWTEGTAAQNVTLDIGKVRLVRGNYSVDGIYVPTYAETLVYARRFFTRFATGQDPDDALCVMECVATNAGRGVITFPSPMRTISGGPTLIVDSVSSFRLQEAGAAALTVTSFTLGNFSGFNSGDLLSTRISAGVSSGLTAGRSCFLFGTGTAARMSFSARL